MLRYGRQTVSVDVSSGVVLFDKKLGSFSIEKVSHARSKRHLLRKVCDDFLLTLKYNHNLKIHTFYLSVLQIVKLQSTPAKVRLVVDSYHHTPREMTFESARVQQHEEVDHGKNLTGLYLQT